VEFQLSLMTQMTGKQEEMMLRQTLKDLEFIEKDAINLDFALGISEAFLSFSDKVLSSSLLSDIVETSLKGFCFRDLHNLSPVSVHRCCRCA